MANHPRLFRRGATFYHRAAIPADIKVTYPKAEETISLRTKDFREAVRMVRIEAARVDRLFDAHRHRLTREPEPALAELTAAQLSHISEAYYAHLLDEDEELRLAGFDDRSFEEHSEEVDALADVNRHNLARGIQDTFFTDEAAEVLTWTNVDLKIAPSSPSWPRLIRELQSATVRAHKAKCARNAGDVIDTPVIRSVSQAIPAETPLLSQAINKWIEEKSRTSWVPKTADAHRIWADRFVIIAGDKPLEAYNKADGRSFKETLMALPANWTGHPDLKDMRINEAATKAAALQLPPMSISNINKIIGFVGAFWNWAKAHYDGVTSNPFDSMKLQKSGKARDERDKFTPGELKSIFSAPLYIGCRSRRSWGTPGSITPRDIGLFWVPLIALFTGARSGEIIQLYTSDIVEENGILRFELTDDGDDQRLKTTTSHRFIPVHPILKELGLPRLIQTRREKQQKRLFPEMPKGKDGYYSSPYSSKFRNLLKGVGAKTQKNAFHSFRHSFEDACRDSGISSELMNALQGHTEGGMAARYGSGFSLQRLAEAMEKLEYPGLDLSHLKPD
ncbi:site-specific integrase [Hoeflea sp. AS60]|uniref:site-specific integrase n=1 Tax=Hoeflea sp. AS60 TaxID=3135780 RepID=UPI00317470F8